MSFIKLEFMFCVWCEGTPHPYFLFCQLDADKKKLSWREPKGSIDVHIF